MKRAKKVRSIFFKAVLLNSMDESGIQHLLSKIRAGRHFTIAALNDVVRRALQASIIPQLREPCGH